MSGAGDVNGDGIDDVLIGALGADPNGASQSGTTYLVYGSSSGMCTAAAMLCQLPSWITCCASVV